MKTFKCLGCRRQVPANPRVKDQKYCGWIECQRARKKKWQRRKMASDPDYRDNHHDAQKQWKEAHPEYWKNYRKNKQKHPQLDAESLDVKMDALLPNILIFSGEYLISPFAPSGAKMDSIRAKIDPILSRYPNGKKDTIGKPFRFLYE